MPKIAEIFQNQVRTPIKNISLLVLSVIFSLGLGEIFIRLCVPLRNVGPSLSVYDPYYGKRLKKNFECIRMSPEFVMHFSTNSVGFRGPEPSKFPKRPILFLGDSFTMGYGVDDGKEFPELVRKSLSKLSFNIHIPVVNIAIGDNGNGRWIKFLNKEGQRYNPRMVVIQMCSNDLSDNLRERLFHIDHENQLIENTNPPKTLRWTLQYLVESVPGLDKSYLIHLLRQLEINSLLDGFSRQQNSSEKGDIFSKMEESKGSKLTLRLVQETVSICKKHNWPILAITIGFSDMPLDTKVQLTKIFTSNNISVIHIPSKQERPELYYEVDGHWNETGHAFVAAQVVKELPTGKELKY